MCRCMSIYPDKNSFQQWKNSRLLVASLILFASFSVLFWFLFFLFLVSIVACIPYLNMYSFKSFNRLPGIFNSWLSKQLTSICGGSDYVDLGYSHRSSSLLAHISFDFRWTTCYVTASIVLKMELINWSYLR